jgi:glycosyltransferase involved in cell wall biosynthesis
MRKEKMTLLLFMTHGMSLRIWQDIGSIRRELAIYERMARQGWRINIISWGGREEKTIAAQFPWLAVHFNKYNLPLRIYSKFLPLIHAVPLLRADIVKSNQVSGADLALRCARFWKRPFIARCGYLWSHICSKQYPTELNNAKKLEHKVFSQSDLAIVTTEFNRAILMRDYNIPPGHVKCVPNYVPDYFFIPTLPEFSQGKNNKIITQVGRLSSEKNLFALLDACSGLDVTLRLVGEGPDREELVKRAAVLGIRLELTGNIPNQDLPGLLAQSTVCTLVSEFEGHPKSLIEYMARGCAILATNVDGIAPLIRNGENGILCETDAASIRAGLKILLADSDLCSRLGVQARKDAVVFSLDRIVKQELELYMNILSRNTPSPPDKARP